MAGKMAPALIRSTFDFLVGCAMNHKMQGFNERMDKLIVDNAARHGQTSRTISIRGNVIHHSQERMVPRALGNGRPLPVTALSVHFDFFEHADDLYKEYKKYEYDKKVMIQCLNLLTFGLDEWVDIRNCLPHMLDAYLSEETKTPRTTDDILWNIKLRRPHLAFQVEEYLPMFAVYGLSDIMGL